MTKLEQIIRAEIRDRGPMRFDRFMEMALYQPGLGYYARGEGTSPVGRSGDFFTSVSVGPLFGRLLARQFFQMWKVLGKSAPFWIVEQGAHDGRLATDILEWCRTETPEFSEAIRYGVVGRVDAKFASIPTRFENLPAVAELKPTGIFFSNELVDAFPVRSVIYKSGQWRERLVTVDERDAFVWADEIIQNAEMQNEIAARSIPEREGYCTEINFQAHGWMREVAAVFERGYVLTIDYGFPASVYYADFRMNGTLTARDGHRVAEDVLAEPGSRDITAHVDFTALARIGGEAGLETLGFVDQQRFLMGIAHDELSGVPGPKVHLQESLRSWNTLTHPEYLGARFHALLQGKNAPAQLDGLRFARPGGLE